MANQFPWNLLNPFFYLSVVHNQFLKPDFSYKSIADIRIDELKNAGIKYVCFDMDNTLSLHGENTLDSLVSSDFMGIASSFDAIGIISNTSCKRKKELQKYFDEVLPDKVYVTLVDMMKPDNQPFEEFLNKFHAAPGEVLMVGDTYLTDIAGAKAVGMKTAKIDPLNRDKEPWYAQIVRQIGDATKEFYDFCFA